MALAALVPAAVILSPSILNVPVDLAMGIIIPYHMHVGITDIIDDYVPRQNADICKLVLGVITVITAYGLFKINICGQGITESVKSLWRETKKPKKDTK